VFANSPKWFLPVLGFALLAHASAVQAGCTPLKHQGQFYTVCEPQSETTTLEVFNLNDEGQPFRYFSALALALSKTGKRLEFAMNAGMFDDRQRPIGLYVEDGKQTKKLNRRNGFGNFHLKPNGVFYIVDGKPGVMESDAYAKSGLKPEFASQSGPMLVVNGELHPKFSATGTSRKIRNGVGINGDGRAVFAISDNAVTFHEFASLFRDQLNCRNALFFDGSVSGLYARELGRNDGFLPLGPMVGAYEMQ
jgi:prepilin-type processing-associated H-X9-DG protein